MPLAHVKVDEQFVLKNTISFLFCMLLGEEQLGKDKEGKCGLLVLRCVELDI